MNTPILQGDSTVRNIQFMLRDTSGNGVESLTYSDVTVKYKPLGSSTWITPTLAVGNEATPVSNGFVEDSDGDGVYWYGLPVTAFASAPEVTIKISGTGFATTFKIVQVWAVDPQDSDSFGVAKTGYKLASDGFDSVAPQLKKMFAGARIRIVDASDFTPTDTVFEVDDTTDAELLWLNQGIFWTTGANSGTTAIITGYQYADGKVKITTSQMNSAPSNGDEFIVMGRR